MVSRGLEKMIPESKSLHRLVGNPMTDETGSTTKHEYISEDDKAPISPTSGASSFIGVGSFADYGSLHPFRNDIHSGIPVVQQLHLSGLHTSRSTTGTISRIP